MAAPETQFQQSGLNIPYNYSPVETKLNPPIQLPGTGELWANVGKTALAAAGQFQSTAQMMQQSPMNPAVKAAQDYQVAQNQAAKAHVEWLQAQGRAGQMVMGSGAQGLETVPAGRSDIDAMVRMALRSAPAPPQEKRPATTEQEKPATAAPTTAPEQPEEGYSASAGMPRTAPPAPTTTQPKTKTQTHTPGDELTGPSQADVNAGVAEALSRNRFASSEQGVPANYQPPQPGGGSIWSPQRPSPMAPPAPGAPPADQPSTPGTVPGSLSDQYAQAAQKQALAQWQQQNLHPVVSPQAFLTAYRENVSTKASDATYMPSAGPGGTPAFSIGMKGGGTTLLPLQQIAQTSWGGPLIAAHNASQILSHQQDQADSAQQPGAQGQPLAPQSDQGQPQPGAQPQIAQGPPAAPTGPLPGAQGQPPAPQAVQGQPPAAPGYNALAYQMPQGPTLTQAGDVNPALMAGGDNAQAVAAAQPPVPQIDPTDFNANVKGYSKEELAKMKKDPDLGNYAGFNWRQDRQFQTKYAVMRDGSSPFKELRWNAGLDQWVPTYKENGQLMEQVQAARAQVPLLNGMLSDTEISNMSEDDLKETLDSAVRLAKTGGDASDLNSLHIRGTINQSKALGRTLAMLEAAKKEGISPKLFSGGAQESSEQASERGGTLPAEGEEYPLPVPEDPINPSNIGAVPGIYWDLGWAASHGARANLTRGQISPLADQMKAELKYFTEQMQQTPGINVTSEPKAAPGEVKLGGGYQGFGGSASVKLPTDESTLKDIKRMSQGNNIDDMIAGAKELKKKVDADILDSTDRATRMGYRTPPQFKNAAQAIKDGKNIEDNENQFVDKNGNPVMPDHYKNPPGRASKIPIGTGGELNTQVEDEMKRLYGNRPIPTMRFDNIDDATKFSKGAKSGTLYDVKDSQGVIHHMRVD